MTPADLIKTVAPISEAMLPSNSTPLEKVLLCVELAALAETDVAVIATIWSPFECPAALLPWLAWSVSVDVWDTGWPEEVQRAAIAASPQVHRLKGTRGAVERALAALGIKTTIVEWWQQTPPARRGTFEVTAFITKRIYADGPFLDARLQAQALESVRASKPKSRVFTFKIGLSGIGSFQMASAGEAVQLANLAGASRVTDRAQGAVGVATAGEAVQLCTASAKSKTPTNGMAGVNVANAGTTIQIGQFRGEARVQ